MPAMNIHTVEFITRAREQVARVYMPELNHYGYDGSLHYTAANTRYERALIRKAKERFQLTGQKPCRREEGLTEVRQYYKQGVLVVSRTCIEI